MKIQFSCPGCQKLYSVSLEVAGKQATCKQCGTRMTVPNASQKNVSMSDARPVANAPRPPSQTQNGNRPAPSIAKAPQNPWCQVDQSIFLPAPPARDERKLPDPSHLVGDTFASNPGKLKVSPLRYMRAYPTWFWIWHLSLLGSIALSIYSLWFIPLAAFFVFCVWFYWNRVKNQFQNGCANPAIIVSMDPPLIAAYTDLTKGNYETTVVKICQQPIHRMSTGPAKLQQRVATIAFYEDRFDNGPHWSTFDPKIAACASSDLRSIEQVNQSFDDNDWRELENALRQVPQPFTQGHYRIYALEEMQRPPINDLNTIYGFVQHHTLNNSRAKANHELSPEDFQLIRAYVGNIPDADIWCLVKSINSSDTDQQGLVLTAHGFFYNFQEVGRGHIPWQHLVGALSSNSGLEIMMRNGQRMLIPERHFMNSALENLDVTLDAIAGRAVF